MRREASKIICMVNFDSLPNQSASEYKTTVAEALSLM